MPFNLLRLRASTSTQTIRVSNWYHPESFQVLPGMAEQSNFELYRGTCPTLRFQLITAEPEPGYVTDWTTMLVIEAETEDGNAVFTANGTLANVANALELGIFEVTLTEAQTNLLEDKAIYDWSFWRTNAGYIDVLAFGEVRAWEVPSIPA